LQNDKARSDKSDGSGARVTHRYFMDDEFITMKNGRIVDETGTVHGAEFWYLRNHLSLRLIGK